MRIIDEKLPNIQVNIKSSADENLIFFENFSKKRKKSVTSLSPVARIVLPARLPRGYPRTKGGKTKLLSS